jgi:cytochrome oxidase Cu insertion factor (SCO1/SenC/PrrC family)
VVGAITVLASLGLAWPVSALADGDPASDFLYTQSVFLPTSASPAQRTQLVGLATLSKQHGVPVKVAVISSAYDLGSVTPLWAKPQRYAQFLGAELSSLYNGPLLVVMPNGLGMFRGGRPVVADMRALRGVTIGPGLGGLVTAAETSVRRLASAAGRPLPAIPAAVPPSHQRSAPGGSRWPEALAVIAVLLGLGVIGAAWTVSVRRRPLRSARMHRARLAFTRLGTLTKALVVAVPVAIAMGVLAAMAFPLPGHKAAAGQSTNRGRVGFTWPADTRKAPEFTLTDQRGSPVSLQSVRGHVAILAFVDPVCRNFCPLEASLLGDVQRHFPAATRPAVIAVSVNPWGNARAHLLQDVRNWRVDWRWAVGSHAALARVWRAYGIGVQVRNVKAAGVTVHEITHSEQIYLVDAKGFERQVIPYPFTVSDVLRGLHQLGTT